MGSGLLVHACARAILTLSVPFLLVVTLVVMFRREATDLVLVDKSFPPKRFTVLEGSFSKAWPSLAPGASVTTSVVVDARRAGTFYTHPATLSYKPVAGVETVRG